MRGNHAERERGGLFGDVGGESWPFVTGVVITYLPQPVYILSAKMIFPQICTPHLDHCFDWSERALFWRVDL